MTFKEIVAKNRSYRRFREAASIAESTLRDLVELARQTPSSRNAQPLRYVLSYGAATNARIFETLAWAVFLRDWAGPEAGERPAAYIVVLVDKEANSGAANDVGIAGQTILLGAVELGLGGCMIASVKRSELARIVQVPRGFEIALVIALGEPVEKVVLEDVGPGDSLAYYREADGTHHVPKRSAAEIIVGVYDS